MSLFFAFLVIQLGVWEALTDDQADRGPGHVFALDIAPDHSSASIAVAWRRPDGAAQVMLAAHQVGRRLDPRAGR